MSSVLLLAELLVRAVLHQAVQRGAICEFELGEPSSALWLLVQEFRRIAKARVCFSHLAISRCVDIGSRLDGLNAHDGLTLREGSATARQLDVHNVAKLVSGMFGDANCSSLKISQMRDLLP